MGSLWDPFGKFVVGLRALAAGLRSFEIGLQTLKIKLRSWEFGFRGFLAVASVCVQGPRTLIGRAWTVAGIHWELFVLYTKSIGKSMLCTQKIIGNCMFLAQESLGTVCFYTQTHWGTICLVHKNSLRTVYVLSQTHPIRRNTKRKHAECV